MFTTPSLIEMIWQLETAPKYYKSLTSNDETVYSGYQKTKTADAEKVNFLIVTKKPV